MYGQETEKTRKNLWNIGLQQIWFLFSIITQRGMNVKFEIFSI